MTGKIIFYNNVKEFGFIRDAASGDEYFFHARRCKYLQIAIGDNVSFQLEPSKVKIGLVNAVNVALNKLKP